MHNRKPVCLLLTLALLVVSTVSNASWRCPDNRPCPDSCRKAGANGAAMPADCGHMDTVAAPADMAGRACCLRHKVAPATCHTSMHAKGPGHRDVTAAGSHCVLRVQSHPEARFQSSFDFAAEYSVVLPVSTLKFVLRETARHPEAFVAPPPRAGGTSLRSPRAPPILLFS